MASETSLVNDRKTKSTEPHVSDHIVVTYWHQIVNKILTAASNYFTQIDYFRPYKPSFMRPSLVIIRFHIRHVLRNKYVMKHLDFNLFGQSVNSRFYHGHAIISRLGFVEGERNHTVWYFS